MINDWYQIFWNEKKKKKKKKDRNKERKMILVIFFCLYRNFARTE